MEFVRPEIIKTELAEKHAIRGSTWSALRFVIVFSSLNRRALNLRYFLRPLLFLIVLNPGFILAQAQGPAEAEDQSLRAMFAHGLAEPALNYVRARRKLEESRANAAWWVMREMECHARWAMQDTAEAERHWSECDARTDEYKRQYSKDLSTQTDARWPWIEWQIARCRLLKAQSYLAVYLATPTNSAAREQSLELVREILQRTDDLSKEIRRRQPLAARQTLNDESEAPAEQLRSLDADAQLLQCEALLIRWQLYPPGSDDRAASLAEVRTTAADFLRTRTDAVGRASLQYAEAIAELESGDQAALLKLEQLAVQADTLNIRMLAAGAVARSLARSGQESRAQLALDLLKQTAALDDSLVPQLHLAQIEVALARLELSKAPGKENELAELVKQAQQLGARYGDYWQTRAEALLIGKLSSDSVTDSQLAMDLLLAEVRQLTAQGDETSIQAAAKKLLQGRDAQATSGKGAAAINLASQAAALYRELNAWDDAVKAVQQTSLQFASEASAAEAHLWAVEAQVQLLRKSPTDSRQRGLYVELLSQQLQHWPEAAASQKAKKWLRDWCLALEQRKTYVETLLAGLPACSNSELGQFLVLECCEQSLQLGYAERVQVINKWLLMRGDQTRFPLSAISNQAALAVVILSDVATADFLRSESTRQQNWTEFEENLRAIPAGVASEFFGCVADIGKAQLQLPNSTTSKSWNQLADGARAALVYALVDALDCLEPQSRTELLTNLDLDKNWAGFNPQGLDPQGLSAVTVGAAKRMAHWLGDSEAMSQLKLLAEKYPRDGNLQLLYAYQLAEQKDLPNAKKIVMQLAVFSVAGSQLKLASQWALMRFQIASAEQATAERAARLLLASQPDLNTIWQLRFKSIAGP